MLVKRPQGVVASVNEEELTDCISKNIAERLVPQITKIYEWAKANFDQIYTRLDEPNHDMAALINDVQALQARVRSLEFEIGRLERQGNAVMEPSPWGEANRTSDGGDAG